jgi:D-3-phosphoglycerate dehydrogenase
VVDPVVEDLIVELLEWIVMRERTYEEVMGAWRTSCSKLPIWEEAMIANSLQRETGAGDGEFDEKEDDGDTRRDGAFVGCARSWRGA